MGKLPYLILFCATFLISYQVNLIGGTDCYVCYSWKGDQGCEEDYVVNINLTTCGIPPSTSSSYWKGDRDREREERDRVYNVPPSLCVKDVITFINPSVRSQNDRYNRFNRRWVERKCGNPIQAGYRSGRDFVDSCEETEVIIEGVAGIKRSCTCSVDGCNTAVSMKTSGTIIYSLIGAIVSVQIASGIA